MVTPENSVGVLTVAFGKRKYLKQAETLALSLKANMPDLPVALVTDNPNYSFAAIDQIIPFNSKLGRGMMQKLHLDAYTPFEETLYIDSDSICLKPFNDELQNIRRNGFSPIWSGFRVKGQSDPYVESLDYTLDTLKIQRLPKFNGGLYYFNGSEQSKAVFKTAREIASRSAELRLRDYNTSGPNDETIFSLAMECCGQEPYNAQGKFMKTPIRAKGRVDIDPLKKICGFIDKVGRQEPAILHFAGPWTKTIEYRFCEWYFHTQPSELSYSTRNKIFKCLQYLTSVPITYILCWGISIFRHTRKTTNGIKAVKSAS